MILPRMSPTAMMGFVGWMVRVVMVRSWAWMVVFWVVRSWSLNWVCVKITKNGVVLVAVVVGGWM